MVFRMTHHNEELANEESKKKPSEKKLQANRANAKRSTGPRNTTVTRYNSLRHGLRALSKLDYAAGYNELLEHLIEEEQPVGAIEMHFVEGIAFEMTRIPEQGRRRQTTSTNGVMIPSRPSYMRESWSPDCGLSAMSPRHS